MYRLVYCERYKLQNFWPYETHFVNKYAKEKEEEEKNTTTLAIYQEVLPVTMGNYFTERYTSRLIYTVH